MVASNPVKEFSKRYTLRFNITVLPKYVATHDFLYHINVIRALLRLICDCLQLCTPSHTLRHASNTLSLQTPYSRLVG